MLEVIDAKTSGTRLQQDKESGLYQAKFVIPQYCHLVGKPTGLSVDKKFKDAFAAKTDLHATEKIDVLQKFVDLLIDSTELEARGLTIHRQPIKAAPKSFPPVQLVHDLKNRRIQNVDTTGKWMVIERWRCLVHAPNVRFQL
jgi:hypothetical protein